jgi:hypothetical protein
MSQGSPSKGGFVQGIPQGAETPTLFMASSGCCGTTNQATTSSCCGEPAAEAVAPVGGQTTQGCCGEPAQATTAAVQTGGCCGEPVTMPAGAAPVARIGML